MLGWVGFPSALPFTLHAFSEILVHNDMIISQWCESAVPAHPQKCGGQVTGGHLSTVNGHVQETSLRGSDVVNRKTDLLESFIKRVGRGQRQYSGWLLSLTNAPLVLRRTKWENMPQTTRFDDTCELWPQFPGLSWCCLLLLWCICFKDQHVVRL